MRHRYHPKRLWLQVLLLNCVHNAQAQQELDELMELSPAELGNISVSIASGTVKKLSHSAAVTSVITAEQIATMGATDLHEILETVPGMHVNIQPVTGDYSYSMRGIRNDTNSEVLLMMNGTRFSVPYQGTHMAGMIVPVENIQRIEVIRGPGSALYGADAFAGVINIVTKKAADLDGVTIGARGGNADTKSSWGQYGGQWQGWDVATSLQYSHNGADPDRIVEADALTGTGFSLPRGPISQLLGLGLATAAAFQIGPDVGMSAQKYLTTAIPFNLTIVNIAPKADLWGRSGHFVAVEWQDLQ